MKTILVPVDYSQDAQHALLYALEMASVAHADIMLLHAFHEPLSLSDAYQVDAAIARLEKEKCKELEEYADKVRHATCKDLTLHFNSTWSGYAGEYANLPLINSRYHTVEIDKKPEAKAKVNITCVCKFGVAFDKIIVAAEEYKADLVVMGMRGGGAISQAFLGRTTLAVMQNIKVPVLAVPENVEYKGLKSIVFATDLTRLPDDAVLCLLRDFVKVFKSKLQVLYLYKEHNQQAEPNNIFSSLEALDLDLYDIDYKVCIQERENVTEGIQGFVKEQQADLLVLIPQKHTFLEKLLNQSVTGKITAEAYIPLLALPSQAIQDASILLGEVVEEQT